MLNLLRESRWLLALALLLCGVLLIWLLSGIAEALLLAWFLAYLLVPLVNGLERIGIQRELASFLVFALGFCVFMLVVLVVLPPLVVQSQRVIHALPDVLARLEAMWKPVIEDYLGIPLDHARWLDWFRESIHRMDLGHFMPWAHWGISAMSGVLDLLIALFKAVLIPLFAYYLLLDWNLISRTIRDRLPIKRKKKIVRLMREADAMVNQFLRGQLVVCAILAGLYSLGLFVAGIPSALAIGVVSGLLAFIPYLGLVIGFAAASFMAIWSYGFDQHLLAVFLVFAVVHAIETFYLAPKVLGKKLGLHPLLVLLALTASAEHFGIIGVLFAVPVTAAASVLVRELDQMYRASSLYREG